MLSFLDYLYSLVGRPQFIHFLVAAFASASAWLFSMYILQTSMSRSWDMKLYSGWLKAGGRPGGVDGAKGLTAKDAGRLLAALGIEDERGDYPLPPRVRSRMMEDVVNRKGVISYKKFYIWFHCFKRNEANELYLPWFYQFVNDDTREFPWYENFRRRCEALDSRPWPGRYREGPMNREVTLSDGANEFKCTFEFWRAWIKIVGEEPKIENLPSVTVLPPRFKKRLLEELGVDEGEAAKQFWMCGRGGWMECYKVRDWYIRFRRDEEDERLREEERKRKEAIRRRVY